MLVDMAENAKIGVGDGNCEDKTVERSLHSKNSNKADYLTLRARLAFTELRKAFIETSILQHFDLEYHIRIKIDVLSYTIGGVLS